MSDTTASHGLLSTPPQETRPFALRQGGGRGNLLGDQVARVLAGADETANTWAIMTLDAPKSDHPIMLHSHELEDEYFFCQRGQLQFWLEDESRILNPGDFAYAPRRVAHAYKCLAHYSGFIGPVLPAGWERFFEFLGEPYEGTPYPPGYAHPVPFEMFPEAGVRFRQSFFPDRPFAPATTDAPDDALPDVVKPYFLKAGEGPRHLLGGQLQTILCGAAQTDGAMTMTTLELGLDAEMPAHAHERTIEGLIVLDGRLRVWLDGDEYLLTGGDFASIPVGTVHSYRSEAEYTRVLTNNSPGGLERLFMVAGQATPHRMFPAVAEAIDLDRLREAAQELDIGWVDAR